MPFDTGQVFGVKTLRSGVDHTGEIHRKSRVFVARREPDVPRCDRPIKAVQEIRYHDDFPSVVHDGCKKFSMKVPRRSRKRI
jgi:hypothetical protein